MKGKMLSLAPMFERVGMHRRHLLGMSGLFCTFILASTLPVLAQQGPPPTAEKEQKDAAQKVKANQGQLGFKVDAGYLLRPGSLGGAKANDFFYKLQYQGRILGEHGSPFQDANTYSGVDIPKKPGGDTQDLFFRFENGAGAVTGPVADVLKIQPFTSSPTNFLSQIRGAAQVYGQINGGRISAAVGLEAPPVAPLSQLLGKRFRLAGVTNWLIFGIQGAAENKANSVQMNGTTQDGTNNLGMITYRSYLATSGSWVYSQSSRNEQKAMQSIADQAGPTTFVDLRNFLTQHLITKGSKSSDASTPSSGQKVADAVAKLSDTEKATIEKYMEDFYKQAPLVRLVKPDKHTIQGIRVGNQTQVIEDASNWELDITGFLKAIKTEPAGTSLEEIVRRRLRDVFINGIPSASGFPSGDAEDRTLLKPYLTNNPPLDPSNLPTDVRRGVVHLLNLALSESLLLEDRTPLKTAVPNETQRQQQTREALNQPIITRNAARQELLDALTDVDANDPIRKITENNKANPVDDSYASRLLVEKVYPTVVRGMSGTSGTGAARDVWNAKLKAFIADTFLLPDRPRYTASFEAVGQWLAVADTYQGNRFRTLLAPSFTYFFNPQAERRQWIRIRYENGRDRTVPKDYRNQILFTIGFDL